MARGDSYELQGLNGSRVYTVGQSGAVTDGGDGVQGFRCLVMVADTVLQTVSATNIQNVTAYNGVTLGAGFVLFGNMTGFTVQSGGPVQGFFM